MMNKRSFLIGAVSGAGVLLAARYALTGGTAGEQQTVSDTASGVSTVGSAQIDSETATWREFAPQGMSFPAADDTLNLSKEQWRERLDELAFQVLRKEGTERPFTSPLNKEYREGLFTCAGCDLPLFTSAMKYDSGTGWPSFTTTIKGHIETKRDFKLIVPRTEYHCIRCGGHQGHVFKDGPAPTGQRWCNNGVALKFLPA